MKLNVVTGALTLAGLLLPVAAVADDPNDPLMKDPRARARDREMIRRLNEEELAYVRKRDAAYAADWRAYRELPARKAEHARAVARYEEQRQQYERDMAAWRRAVAACRAGQYEYCDR